MELNAFSQVEGPGQAVVGSLPALSQTWLELHVRVLHQHCLIYMEHYLVGWPLIIFIWIHGQDIRGHGNHQAVLS